MAVKIKESFKLSPRLRMILNGDTTVNSLRAEQDPALAVLAPATRRRIPRMLAGQVPFLTGREAGRKLKRGKLRRIPSAVHANVLIRLQNTRTTLRAILKDHQKDFPEGADFDVDSSVILQRGDVVSATLPLNLLPLLASDPRIVAIESPGSLAFLPPLDAVAVDLAAADLPTPPDRWQVRPQDPRPSRSLCGGSDVLVGIVDVQGFDFSHPDFLNPDGTTRFEAIWDQAGDSHPAPSRFGYGSELTHEMLNKALKSENSHRLPAVQLEPQSEMVPGSHGTHVASIAAGNGGLCPKARIAAVLLSLSKDDHDRRASFYDSTRLIHAVDYLFQLGSRMGIPVAVNISLGTNGHSHDGTSLVSRWLDYELATPGRAVCIAAGNTGQEAPASAEDIGYMLGRIHTSGRLSSGQPGIIQWEVIGNGISDISENELEIWYSECDHFSVQVKPPFGDWSPVVQPGDYLENSVLPSKTVLSIYNERFIPMNGLNYIACYLSPYLSEKAVIGIQSGTWQVRLIPESVRDGRYHGWIERDDPYRANPRSLFRQVWAFPSFFPAESNVDNTSVTSLACGHFITSVANYDPAANCIHRTSSQGPTRDGRAKPDIAAPGTAILAARGFTPSRSEQWLRMTGTSMASPYVCGVVAAMLSVNPRLTAAQVNGILHHTARPLYPCPEGWEDRAGFGVIDPLACLDEVGRIDVRKDLNP